MLARFGQVLGEIQVVPATLGELSDSELLDDAERARAEAFALDAPRRRFVAARAFLRSVLGRALGRDPRALRFQYGPFGKPSLAGADGALRFNVAHAGDRVAVALATDREVGLDLEVRRQIRPSVARALLSRRERAGHDERALRLLVVAKEALVKAEGTSVFRARDFDLALGEHGPRVVNDPTFQLSTLVHDAHSTVVVAARGRFTARFVS